MYFAKYTANTDAATANTELYQLYNHTVSAVYFLVNPCKFGKNFLSLHPVT